VNDGSGASGLVPAAKAERPLSVQSGDVCGDNHAYKGGPDQRPGGRESLVRHRDKPRVPRLARADINFLAGIIKQGYPTAPYLSDMRLELLVASMGEKTMESFAYGIGNLVGFQLIVGLMFGIYLAPSIVAVVRGHHRWPSIGLLNFAAGWTVVGWIGALVWSVTAVRQPAEIMRIGSTALGTAQLAAA